MISGILIVTSIKPDVKQIFKISEKTQQKFCRRRVGGVSAACRRRVAADSSAGLLCDSQLVSAPQVGSRKSGTANMPDEVRQDDKSLITQVRRLAAHYYFTLAA